MTRFARQSPISVGMQANIGAHSNRSVCTRESRLGAHRIDLRVSDMACGSVEQPFNRVRSRRDLLKA
jgi:hypothetical protein